MATLRESLRNLSLTDRFRLGTDIGAFLLLVGTAYGALELRRLARYFPMWVSIVFGLLALANIVNGLRYARKDGSIVRGDAIDSASMSAHDDVSSSDALRITIRYLLWVIGYVALVYIIGMRIATVVFLVLWLRIIATAKWQHIALAVVAMLGLLFLVTEALGFRWPHSLIEIWR